jgi:peroxiredoxin
MRTFLFVFCLTIYAACLNAQTHISGSAPKYKGDELTFCCYDNYITKNEKFLAKCNVDEDGNFEVNVDISYTQYIFVRYEKLVYYFFVQPNTNIKVEFNEKELLSDKEKLNPFFEPSFIAANVINTSDSDFNNRLVEIDKGSDNVILEMVKNKKESDREFKDSLLNIFKNSVPKTENEFINNYVKYRIATLEYALKLRLFKDLQSEYFTGKPILHNNPAYCELFGQFYDKYLLHRTQQAQGKGFKEAINKANLSKIREVLSKNDELANADFCELLILQNAFNEFYDSNFSRPAILKIVDYIAEQTSNSNNKKIATDIRNKITKLLAGYAPPNFQLPNLQAETKSINSFAGKYIYLGFFSVNSYGCIQDFYLINRLAKKFGKKIQFVSICVDKQKDIENFVKTEKFNWTFLVCNNQAELLKEYDIRTFPTYYLIDTSGKLLKSPAPSPSEGIDAVFEELK